MGEREPLRQVLAGHPTDAARALLGATLHGRGVSVRIVEVEAYCGEQDPASHAYRGRSRRNTVMFGPAGHLYAYFVYGMHTCVNVSTGPDGVAVATARRPTARRTTDLARGPANLALALRVTLADSGTDLLAGADVRLELRESVVEVAVGPRVGVSAAADVPWRFWVPGSPAVSAYRRAPRAPG